MTHILASIRRLRRGEYREPPVHFHSTGGRQPEVCYDQKCGRPRLHVG